MKIFKVYMVLTFVIPRLKEYDLGDYNNSTPIIFVEAEDPDDACYKATHNLASTLLRKDHSVQTLNFIKDIMHDVRIIKIEVPS